MSLIDKLKKHKERWEFEVDMVKEFDKDDNLCLNAICALRRQRIIIDDYDFLRYDLMIYILLFLNMHFLIDKLVIFCLQIFFSRINQLALLLIDGDSQGKLKKKASGLIRLDLVQCRKFAKKYSTKVFEIYQKKNDPFFPSSRS